MLTNSRFAARTATYARLVYAPATALRLSLSRSFLETTQFLRRYRTSFLAVATALLLVAASGVSAQKPASPSDASNTITLPNGTTITANPNTGEITVNLPKTDTTATVHTKDNNDVTAKDNKTGQPLPKNPPAKPAAGGGGGGGNGGKSNIVVTPNPDGSITVTVTNGGQTETFTVNPETDPQTGQTTTTVTSPEDPKSSVAVTNDKDGNTTGTKTKTPGPNGGSYVVVSPDANGIGHIQTVDENGNVTQDTTYNGATQKVEKTNGIPHVVAKTDEEIKKEQEEAEAKQKAKGKTATGTGTGSEPGPATPQESTGTSMPTPTLVTDTFSGVVTGPATPPANITAYRTGNLSAGDSFSGTIASDTSDPSQLTGLVYQVVEQDPSGNQSVVSQAPVSNGVYKGLIPAVAVAGGTVLIGELLKDGKGVGTATPVPVETQPAETTKPPLTSDSYQIPPLMQAGKPTAIEFQGGDGDLTTTQVTVGGQPVQELAEGPTETMFRSPANVTGPTTVVISKNGVAATGQSRNVAVSLSAVSKSLQTGTQEELTGKVSGLMALDKPVSLTLINGTPTVQLQGGNTQTVTIAPSDVLADGTYTFERDISAEQPGAFNITATLEGLSIPGPSAPATPGGPVIAGGEGTKIVFCTDCTARGLDGPTTVAYDQTCEPKGTCQDDNPTLKSKISSRWCKENNDAYCYGRCTGPVTPTINCAGTYDDANSNGVSLKASVVKSNPLGCPAGQDTCNARIDVANGGKLACKCKCP